jgi:hypothetical protein
MTKLQRKFGIGLFMKEDSVLGVFNLKTETGDRPLKTPNIITFLTVSCKERNVTVQTMKFYNSIEFI